MKKEKADWFIRLVNELPDINERVMVVKNYDLFNADVFESIKDRENIILSGDLDNCTFRDLIIKKTMRTTMLFSQPNIEIDFKMPTVPQYNGYMWGLDKGIVSIKI